MSRMVKVVGGVITAVAVVVVLAFAYLDPGSSAPAVTPAPGSSATSSPLPSTSPTTQGSGCAVDVVDTAGWTWVCLSDLPIQAQQTVALIDSGGPFPYPKDGSTFNNFEGLLPKKPRGYYREYTVPTPSRRDRGPRRIVTGDRDRELFYTEDHYASFVRVKR